VSKAFGQKISANGLDPNRCRRGHDLTDPDGRLDGSPRPYVRCRVDRAGTWRADSAEPRQGNGRRLISRCRSIPLRERRDLPGHPESAPRCTQQKSAMYATWSRRCRNSPYRRPTILPSLIDSVETPELPVQKLSAACADTANRWPYTTDADQAASGSGRSCIRSRHFRAQIDRSRAD
jgi:hypothetical protein